MKLSVIIPTHNEEQTITKIIQRVENTSNEKEIIIVDDCSIDGTREILEQLKIKNSKLKIFFRDKNTGKGAAIRDGFNATTGDIVLIQDADLEYDPRDYEKLLSPILTGNAQVIYGSRIGKSFLNKAFTGITNLVTKQKLTDIMTGYKVFSREALNSIKNNLRENGFGIEVEVTLKLSRLGYKILEVPISYIPRSKKEGKHMKWNGQLSAIMAFFRYGLRKVGK